MKEKYFLSVNVKTVGDQKIVFGDIRLSAKSAKVLSVPRKP